MVTECDVECAQWEITHITQAGGQLIGQLNLMVYSPAATGKSISLSECAKESSGEKTCLWWDLEKW